MRVLIANSFGAGAGDEPEAIVANMRRLEEKAGPLFRCGHVPLIVEWVAMPIWRMEGGRTLGDGRYEEIFEEARTQLVQACEAVLRVRVKDPTSAEADFGKQWGRPVYNSIGDVPGCAAYGPIMAQ